MFPSIALIAEGDFLNMRFPAILRFSILCRIYKSIHLMHNTHKKNIGKMFYKICLIHDFSFSIKTEQSF